MFTNMLQEPRRTDLMIASDDERMSRQRLLDLIQGYRTTYLIVAALRLGLIERLAVAPANEEALALILNAHAPSLRRFIRALGVLGLIERRHTGEIALTVMGRGLLKAESALHDRAILADEEYAPAWANLAHSVLTGKTAFEHVFGVNVWRHREAHRELGECFNRIMSEDHALSAKSILHAFDFTGRTRIVDVGGGHGQVIAAILTRYPRAEGILYDQPHVVEGAAGVLKTSGVLDRCQVMGGSFFDAVPDGGDVYILQHILHDWDDSQCVTILQNCRAAMKHSSTLLIVEHVTPEDTDNPRPSSVVMLDLHMMAVLGGRERTQREYQSLLQATGLHLVRCTPIDSSIHLIEASVNLGR
jgi:O-methyltransferase domain